VRLFSALSPPPPSPPRSPRRQRTPPAPSDIAAYDLTKKTNGETDLPRLRAGRVGGQFWSVYVPGEEKSGWALMHLEHLELARRRFSRYPNDLALALTSDVA